MKRIGLTLIAFLLMTSVALAKDEYCKNVGDIATQCQKEKDWQRTGKLYLEDSVVGKIRPWEYLENSFYIVVRDPSQPSLSTGNMWSSYTYTWNSGTSEWYKLHTQVVNPNYSIDDKRNERIESEYARIDNLLQKQCEYPDENGFRIPYTTKERLIADYNAGTPDSYFAWDIDNSKFVELTPSGANDAAKLVTIKNILVECRSEFKTEKNKMVKDHPDTSNAACTALDLPWDCCTDVGQGTCDDDSFINYMEACEDEQCINSTPFNPVDHGGTTQGLTAITLDRLVSGCALIENSVSKDKQEK